MSMGPPVVQGEREPRARGRRFPAEDVRPAAVQALAIAVAGVVVGGLWAAITPTVRGWSDVSRQAISGEVAFSGLAILAGVVVAVIGVVRPGRRPVAGVVVRLVASGVASLLAWGVGRAAGAPVLEATGVLVLWPLTVAGLTALITLGQVLADGDSSAAPHPGSH